MTTEGYDPEWLELEASLGKRPVLIGDVHSIISQYNSLGAVLGEQWGPPSDAVEAYDEKINEHVTVHIYTPTNPNSAGQKLPVGVYYHGGGYISGNLDFEDAICRFIAEQTPCILVSVDYRLAPEYKLPTGIDDSHDAYVWAHEDAARLNGNPEALFAIGGSAGGGVALAVTDMLVRNGQRHLIQGTVAMNPITSHMDNPPAKYKHLYKSYTENAVDVPLIDRHCMNVAFESAGAQPTDSTVFVSISPHLASYPPVYLVTCEKDILRDDGIVLEHALKDAGVKVKRDHYTGFPHYFFVFPSLKTGRTFGANVVKGIRFVLGRE